MSTVAGTVTRIPRPSSRAATSATDLVFSQRGLQLRKERPLTDRRARRSAFRLTESPLTSEQRYTAPMVRLIHPPGQRREAIDPGKRALSSGALAALLALVFVTIQCAPSNPAPPHVLLITVDTLRADHLSCYGYRLPTSPVMDRLAEGGVLFEDCSVQWPKTWPSIASFLAGSYPRSTGVRAEQRTMAPSLRVLAEVFQGAGYATAGVVSNFNLSRQFGYDQGFSWFVESWAEGWSEVAGNEAFRNTPGKVKEFTNATLVTDQGLEWLDRHPSDQPFFLWLHYMDPHGPYVPPAQYSALFEGDHPTQEIPPRLIPPYQRQQSDDALITDLAHYKAQYDREIRYLDDELGRLFEGLRERGQWQNTLVVLTADHGESLDEHSYVLEHGGVPYQPTARIPLLFHWEGVLPTKRLAAPVGLVDASKTILELVGLPVPGRFEGLSLKSMIDGTPGAPTPPYVFAETGIYAPSQLSVREGPWKLVWVRSVRDRRFQQGSEFELYDLDQDPLELDNVARRHPEKVKELQRVLEEWMASGPAPPELESTDLDELDEASQEMLRALGYVK